MKKQISRRNLIGTVATRIEHYTGKVNPLVDLIDEAQRAMTYTTIQRDGLEDTYLPKKAASLRTLVLKDSRLPVINGNATGVPGANLAAESILASKLIARESRVADAGASVILLPDHLEPKMVGKDKVMSFYPDYPKAFVNVDAAQFAEIPDDVETPTSNRPLFIGDISLNNLRQFSVRFNVNRREQKMRGEQQVADELLTGIFSGISRTCDKVFLDAVMATMPENFGIDKAAAKGARIDKLRALVGNNGLGASWRGDGVFSVAGGIPAELTAATDETIVGWFERGALLIGPDLSIYAERLNVNGDVSVSAWFSLATVIPDVASFWKVAA